MGEIIHDIELVLRCASKGVEVSRSIRPVWRQIDPDAKLEGVLTYNEVKEIVERDLVSKMHEIVPMLAEVLMTELEKKGDQPTHPTEEEGEMLRVVREKVMLRMTNLGTEDLRIIQSLVTKGKLKVVEDREEQYATLP